MPSVQPRMPWRVAAVEAIELYVLSVRFLDGTQGEVDMRGLILSARAGVFSALLDADLFREVRVEYGAVVWPGELDLAPDAMYRAIKASDRWTW